MSTTPWWRHMRILKPQTLDDLWKAAGKHGRFYYRGLTDSKFELIPKLARNVRHIASEWNMTSEFSAAVRSRGHSPANTLEVLALAQHHGLPTRLMDVTSSFGVALYFASQPSKDATSSMVWRMDAAKLSRAACSWYQLRSPSKQKISTEYLSYPAPPTIQDGWLVPVRSDAEIDAQFERYMVDATEARHPPMVISTPHISARISVQDASFLLLDPLGADLGLQLTELASEDALCGIVLSSSLRTAIRKHLLQIGLTRKMLFPDIDNLALELAESYASGA